MLRSAKVSVDSFPPSLDFPIPHSTFRIPQFSSTRLAGRPINIATGTPVSVNEIWQAIAAESATSLQPVRESARAGEIKDSLADVGQAATLLGFRAKTTLRGGIVKLLHRYVCLT